MYSKCGVEKEALTHVVIVQELLLVSITGLKKQCKFIFLLDSKDFWKFLTHFVVQKSYRNSKKCYFPKK